MWEVLASIPSTKNKIKEDPDNNCWSRCAEIWYLQPVGRNVKCYSSYKKWYCISSKKLKMKLSCNLKFCFWVYTPNNWEQDFKGIFINHVRSNMFYSCIKITQVPINKWMVNKMWCIPLMEYCSTLQIKGIGTIAAVGMHLEDMIVSGIKWVTKRQIIYQILE